ncbi:MAG TPA: DUF3379 family protein [Woeseiaceae bacterium]
MNCNKYREAIAADPSESFHGGAAHAAGCDACSRFRQEMRALDERISRALEIDVPPFRMPELPHVGSAGAGVANLRRPLRSMSLPLWAGLAAAVGLVAVLVTAIPQRDPVRQQLVEEIMAHMDHEQESRQVTSVPVAARILHEVVDPEVARMDRGVGLITYAMSCVINGRTVPHLVIQGNTGPVTLILLPEETIDGSITLSGENVHGVLLPVGSGSIAVIGQREEQLGEIDTIGQKLARSVEWNI